MVTKYRLHNSLVIIHEIQGNRMLYFDIINSDVNYFVELYIFQNFGHADCITVVIQYCNTV